MAEKETKILEFKTVSPLFEMERDYTKPFTTRLWDENDDRFKFLKSIRYKRWQFSMDVIIKITNPANGESFSRKYLGYSRVSWLVPQWVNLWLGGEQ